MPQAKFTLAENQIAFVNQYDHWGYSDKSSLVQEALHELECRLRRERLVESATLYAEIYSQDAELQALTDQAIEEWPE